jgi:hypothetical protein
MNVRVNGGTAAGVALIMVVLVLSALAIIGAPFVISMTLQDKASLYFEGQVIAREAAESARNHVIAGLERSVYGVEYEAEAEVLDQERPEISYPGSKARRGPTRRQPRSSRRGMVIRKDRGAEVPEPPRGTRRADEEPDEKKDGMPELPDALRLSKKGPSPREVDGPAEVDAPQLGTVKFPGAGRVTLTPGGGPPAEFSFRDPSGVTAIATAADEQGKININTAPPNLIGSLFGVSQLARELGPRETRIVLADASMFRGDADARTIDGAIVITDPERGITEAVTYRRKEGEALVDCFRGAYLSLIRDHVFPAGTFVYDLRGWKIAYHKLWARREGGFHPRALTRFEAIEAIREVSSWQAASLFVARFRGEGLSAEFLRENGIDQKKLAALGLDPYVFPGDEAGDDPALKKEYEAARKALRAAGIKADLVQKLRDARGTRVVLELAARLEKADRKTADKAEADLARSLSADARRASRMPREYLKQALAELAAAYEAEGLETVLPEDLERVRDAITTSSSLPAEWSEAQAVLDDVSLTGAESMARVPRATELNPGTVIRIRSLSDAEHVEFNEAGTTGKQIPAGGFRFAFPIRSSIKGRDGLVQALQRHPVNVNSASRQVLRAVFTGVRGYEDGQVVTPAEADRLAEYVRSRVPVEGHAAFRGVLVDASLAEIIDGNDVLPLMVNAVAPTHNQLRVSTTGLVYASGDTYTIESRGILRSPAGGEVAHAHLREIVEVSSGRRLSTGLMTQADMADGFYFRDPFLAPGYPESHHQHLLGIPGTRSHLVITRPLLIHRAEFAVPGGDLSTLRLFPSETEVPARLQRFMLGESYQFRETYDGLELAHGEAWTLPTSLALGGPGQVPAPNPTGAANTTPQDLTMVPGGIEFWLRMRTYPDSRDQEGNLILVDAGSDPERNRISLLYADQRGEVKLRIRDSSFQDPSVLRNQETGQYLEVTAKRPLELHTWYHIRIVWDGVFGGGAQLFIDGLPAGTDNLSTELVSAIPEAGQVAAINVKDASKFPMQGVVRIDSELFEYTRSGNTLTIRKEPPTAWRPIPHRGNFTGRGQERVEPPEPPEGGGSGPRRNETEPLFQQAPTVPPAVTGPPGSEIMRSPWNRRGFTASAHQAGAKVILHGYSLPIRRKVRLQRVAGQPAPVPDEKQAGRNDRDIVWGRGGLRSVEPLNAFNFPQGVSEIGHYDISAQELGGQANYLVPLFNTLETFGGGWIQPGTLTATIPAGPQPRNAADYFQSRGVCVIGNRAFFFKKEKLPPQYLAAQAQSLAIRKPGQDTGLRILGDYPGGGLQEWNALRADWDRERGGIPFIRLFEHNLTHRSLLASGPISQVYPPTGILELRGTPTPWEAAYRPNLYGQPAFGKHPDDAVEWMRYKDIYEGNIEGQFFNLFVGNPRDFTFRGYPERHTPGQNDLRKQLDHPAGEPLRLVMELSEGGAGHGDYVTIATKDPNIFEPGIRRVYKVREHQDGRFFVSLLDVGATGMDIPSSLGTYSRNYTMADEPRLVKFPTWGLPEIPTNSAAFFTDALSGAAAASGRSNRGGVRYDEDDDPTGITIDEVRRLQNTTVFFNATPDQTTRVPVWFAVVPLDGGSVGMRQLPDGGQALTGSIPAGRAVSRASPLEVLVVCVSREDMPSIFARNESEGLIRIGDEVFFFEDPAAAPGQQAPGAVASTSYSGGAAGPAAQGGQQQPQQATVDRERDARERQQVWQRIPAGAAGGFEREGFARLDEMQNVEKRRFYEIFYYKQSGFSQCLRGQFGTPIIQDASRGSNIRNVTRRIRLIGRGLLGTERKTHGFGAPAAFVPYFAMSSITGPITDSGLPVKRADIFARSHGYLLLDSGQPNVPWEIMAHLGPKGDGLLEMPRDERGQAMLRARFGTQVRPISSEMFAYELPYRHPDRYEPEREGEALAYLQKSWRIPGAYWREISWVERPARTLRERKADIVVAARFDGAPDWDAKPTNEPGGLYLFADEDAKEGEPKSFPIDRVADQLEIRVYFRYPSGAFTRLPMNAVTDDWKETPILDSLTVEYEKAGAILRHEELPF